MADDGQVEQTIVQLRLWGDQKAAARSASVGRRYQQHWFAPHSAVIVDCDVGRFTVPRKGAQRCQQIKRQAPQFLDPKTLDGRCGLQSGAELISENASVTALVDHLAQIDGPAPAVQQE